MATHTFINLDPIKGESTDDKHKDWIEVFGWGFNVQQPMSGPSGTGGRSAARADFGPLTITKSADLSSPDLYMYCAGGTHISKVKLEQCQETGEKVPYVEIELEECMITGISTSGGGSDRPMESVTLTYDKVKWKNTKINDDGSKGDELEKIWNVKENKKE
jgi:type VI secretion system secreted protein Hcp